MAYYKTSNFLKLNNDAAFDQLHHAGSKAPYAGIYRCNDCGHEIGIANGHTFPPHAHQHSSPIWQLIVFAEHKTS